MYSNDDLNSAVKRGIFTQDSVDAFRDFIAQQTQTQLPDNENFKLIKGFNDIFVSAIIAVLLIAIVSLSENFVVITAVVSWILAEVFVKKRKMAQPAVLLTISFLASVFYTVTLIGKMVGHFSHENTIIPLIAFALTAVAARFHWNRFHVPITIGLGVTAAAGVIFTIALTFIPSLKDHLAIFILLTGITLFLIAMKWDSQDTKRVTYKSDVAFWIHLVASPLMIHSLFILIGVFDRGELAPVTIVSIIAIFAILTVLSLVVDRKIFMLSSLLYVLYALASIFKTVGAEGVKSLSVAAIIIAILLITITLNWEKIRGFVLNLLPKIVTSKVPSA